VVSYFLIEPMARKATAQVDGNAIINRALKKWPVAVLRQCDEQQAEVVGVHLARSIKREEHNEVGMGFILAMVLGTIISEIIKQLLKKWWANHAEMTELCR
jgi:ABC-type nitrate/sulfonate/bicarbonate transport system permease component